MSDCLQMNSIRVLPEEVACRIAAGEVVDRPASIVRELVDNSLDAGADRISIRVEGGGRKSIRVTDNGAGMSRDDLLLSIERHATSKIRSAEDLFSIASLGFRGEALPSIAAVSRVTITSRARGQLSGHRLSISGGRLNSIEETGTPEGTIFEARDLFFNLPARKKFLRAAKTEAGHIIDTVTRMIPSFPEVFFKLQEGGRMVISAAPSDDIVQRLATLMGRETAESLLRGEERFDGFTVKAFLAPGGFARSRADRLFIYVNRRYVRDRLLTRALMEGYGGRLMKGTYPQAVLFVDMDPGSVDVNVHPTKQEIRFHDSNGVYQSVLSAVRNCLGSSPHPVSRFPAGARSVSERGWEYEEKPVPADPLFQTGSDDGPPPPPEQTSFSPDLRVLGCLAGTYLICETDEGMLMVDQHAAHERILYEELLRGLRDSDIQSQAMLLPRQIELSAVEERILDRKGHVLRKLGIDLEHFGGRTYLLRAVPWVLNQVDWSGFISELLASINDEGFEESKIFEGAIAVMACHGSIRAGNRITESEISALFSRLRKTGIPEHCPHGRPVFKAITLKEIEKMFKRAV